MNSVVGVVERQTELKTGHRSDYTPCACGCGEFCRGLFKNGHRPIRSYRVKNYKRLHRLKAEKALGKPLPRGSHVHHVDLTKSDSSALVICENDKYHKLLHNRTRIVLAGGNPNTESWCSYCVCPRSRDNFHVRRNGRINNICKECNKRAVREWKRNSRNVSKKPQVEMSTMPHLGKRTYGQGL